MEISEGYCVDEVPSPLFRGDVCKWFQATAPDGSKGLIYNNAWAATKTTNLHRQRGTWPFEDEVIGSFHGVSPANPEINPMTTSKG